MTIPIDPRALAREYRTATLPELAIRHGVSWGVIRRALMGAGVVMRPAGQRPRDDRKVARLLRKARRCWWIETRRRLQAELASRGVRVSFKSLMNWELRTHAVRRAMRPALLAALTEILEVKR